jgi:hypothetical protein
MIPSGDGIIYQQRSKPKYASKSITGKVTIQTSRGCPADVPLNRHPTPTNQDGSDPSQSKDEALPHLQERDRPLCRRLIIPSHDDE